MIVIKLTAEQAYWIKSSYNGIDLAPIPLGETYWLPISILTSEAYPAELREKLAAMPTEDIVLPTLNLEI
jgi:hypothetical protein